MRYCIEILLNPGWFVWCDNFGKGFTFKSAKKEMNRGKNMTEGVRVKFHIKPLTLI